jgi:hypothetical protein
LGEKLQNCVESPLKLKLLLTFLIIVSLTACATRRWEGVQSEYNADPITVAVPGKLAPERVREVVVYTFERRQWSIVDSSTDRVTATLNHRRVNAKVVAEIAGRTIKLMDYSTDSEGNKIIALAWVKALEYDLNKNFERVIGQ